MGNDKLNTILRALADQSPVIIVQSGVAWEGHIEDITGDEITAVCRILASPAARVRRPFNIRSIDDIARTENEEPESAEEEDELITVSKRLLELHRNAPPNVPMRGILDILSSAMRAAEDKLIGDSIDDPNRR